MPMSRILFHSSPFFAGLSRLDLGKAIGFYLCVYLFMVIRNAKRKELDLDGRFFSGVECVGWYVPEDGARAE